jgi:hypothetical protein
MGEMPRADRKGSGQETSAKRHGGVGGPQEMGRTGEEMAAGGATLHAANPPMAATTPFATVRNRSSLGPRLAARAGGARPPILRVGFDTLELSLDS